MKHIPSRQARCLALTLFSSISLLDAPQARSQPGALMMDVTVSLKVASDAFTSRAPRRCSYAPTASIYGVLSEMWTLRQEVQALRAPDAMAIEERRSRFAVDAKAETGDAITETIRCAAFSPAVAEGG